MAFLENNNCCTFTGNIIMVDIGVDGVPLAKASKSRLWPILGNIYPYNTIFLIGVYHGYKKPVCANEFVMQFVDEMKDLIEMDFNSKKTNYRCK